LVYGTSQVKRTKALTDIRVIDVTEPSWYKALPDTSVSSDLVRQPYICVGQAYTIARKNLSADILIRVDSPEDIQAKEQEVNVKIAAIRAGDIIVTKQHHLSVNDSKAWLSTYHLDLVKELLKEGFVIEILDELNNPITILGDKNE
jgi:hypothetical protein